MKLSPLPPPVWFSCICVSAVIGGLAGWMIGRGGAATGPAAPEPVSVHPVMPLVAPTPPPPLPPENENPLAEEPVLAIPTEVRQPPAASSREPLDFDSILAELEALDMRVVPSRFLAKLSVPVIKIDGSPEITDEVIELFALGEAEVAEINDAIGAAVEQLNRAEMEGLQVGDVSETEASFTIPALGELGDEVEATLRQEILRVLGGADGATFLELMSHSSGRYWNSFGRDEIHLTYSVGPPSGNQRAVTIIRDVRNPGSGGFRERSSRSSSVAIEPGPEPRHPFGREGRRQDYLIDLLPDHLRPYFD